MESTEKILERLSEFENFLQGKSELKYLLSDCKKHIEDLEEQICILNGQINSNPELLLKEFVIQFTEIKKIKDYLQKDNNLPEDIICALIGLTISNNNIGKILI